MSEKSNSMLEPSKKSELNLEQVFEKQLTEQVLAISPIEDKVKDMAEILGCSYTQTSLGWSITKQEEVHMDLIVSGGVVTKVMISFWDEPLFYSPESTRLLQNGNWAELCGHILKILATYDKEISRDDQTNCKGSIKMLELLLTHISQDTSFKSIHRSKYGYYLPSEDLRQGRVYYTVDPLYRNLRARDQVYHLCRADHENLPYFELTFVKSDSSCSLLSYNTGEQRPEIVKASVKIGLKLSEGTPMRKSTIRTLERNGCQTNSIIENINCYQYLAGTSPENDTEDVEMIKRFPEGNAQHIYTLNAESFKRKDGHVINMIYLKKWQDIQKVIAILRNEAMHMMFWTSMLAACRENQGIQPHIVPAIKTHVFEKRKEIVILFETKFAPIEMNISDDGVLGAKVEVLHLLTEMPIAEGLSETWSKKLNESGSVSLMLSEMIEWDGDCVIIKNVKESPHHLLNLPYVVLSRIHDHSDFLSQLRTRKVCRYLRKFIDEKNCKIEKFDARFWDWTTLKIEINKRISKLGYGPCYDDFYGKYERKQEYCYVKCNEENITSRIDFMDIIMGDMKVFLHNPLLQIKRLSISIEGEESTEFYRGIENIMATLPMKWLHLESIIVLLTDLPFFGKSFLPFLKSRVLKEIQVHVDDYNYIPEMQDDIENIFAAMDITQLDHWKQVTRKCLLHNDVFSEKCKVELSAEFFRQFNVVTCGFVFDKDDIPAKIDSAKKFLDLHSNVEKCEIWYHSRSDVLENSEMTAGFYPTFEKSADNRNEWLHVESSIGSKINVLMNENEDSFSIVISR